MGSLGNFRPALDTELAIDSIYHPWPTEFASLIVPRRTFIAGEYLLAAQALQQISLITHQSFDAGVMFETLLTALSQALHR
ncbi:MAG: hypothetical protein EBW21_03990 [Actinobacteria bacterium]|nr:hypothetical protein [Actinomycetota bacterium]